MSYALRVMNDSMHDKLERVRMDDQRVEQGQSPGPAADDDRSVRRVTAKRRKIQ